MIHYTKFDFSTISDLPRVWKKRKVYGRYYINAPFSFDIETTTIKLKNVKGKYRSFMYIWQFGVNGVAVYGRTWEEFKDFLTMFKNALKLDNTNFAIVYVHNLGFEFEFLHSVLHVSNIFARSTHNPIYFDCLDYSIEFRDSYILSGLKLSKTAENLTKHKIEKLNGDDFNYNLIRHNKTELTPLELKYCENDVLILNYFIQEEIEYNGNIAKIPLTRTGYARRRFIKALKQNKDFWKKWQSFIKSVYPTPEQYILLNKCFAGGYNHGNCNYIGFAVENVMSFDYNSSYPAQMTRHMYPMGKWIKVDCKNLTRERFENLMKNNACMCEISFKNLQSTTAHHIISRNKCLGLLTPVVDNGRIVSADICRTFITDVDYRIIKMFYTFDNVMIFQMFFTKYDYLPTPFVEEVLNLFEIKTKLKGVAGKEEEYQRGKGDLNSAYGMCCTNPVSPEIYFDCGEWEIQDSSTIDISEVLTNNKESESYFMLYSTGVWCTAWARYELLSVCYEIDKNNPVGDVIYNDTDSAKLNNYQKHLPVIEAYNKQCIIDIDNALKHHGIDPERARPKTIKGETKQLGIFEVDCFYPLFKTLGCKRYCYMIDGKFQHTASGIPKGKPDEYIIKEAKKQGMHPFDIFDFGLKIPPEYSGNLSHHCYNDRYSVSVTDYQGNIEQVEISSCCVLVPQPYEMSKNKAFLDYLSGLTMHAVNGKATAQIGSKHPLLKIKSID